MRRWNFWRKSHETYNLILGEIEPRSSTESSEDEVDYPCEKSQYNVDIFHPKIIKIPYDSSWFLSMSILNITQHLYFLRISWTQICIYPLFPVYFIFLEDLYGETPFAVQKNHLSLADLLYSVSQKIQVLMLKWKNSIVPAIHFLRGIL